MNIIDPKKEFFCTVPWTHLYQHVNNASPCHANINYDQLSPAAYLKSNLLRSIKRDFVEGRVPPSCVACHRKEKLGIKSTRKTALRYVDYIDKDNFTVDTETKVKRLEIRTTNLCNFKCRMCSEHNSSEIAKEKNCSTPVHYARDRVIDELNEISLESLEVLCLTGGEPMLIKEYYNFLDNIIDKGYNQKITVEIFTNCSVVNPLLMDRLKKFKTISFVMSIDGVGKTAEYQRKGTDWNIVEQNIYKFVVMPKPFELYFNTAISPYVLLDAASLAKFLMKLYSMNNEIRTKCYSTIYPEQLNFVNVDDETKKRILEQIDMAVDILNVDRFFLIRKEFLDIKRNLLISKPKNSDLFVNFTKHLDEIRNEKFEDVFGYKLY